MRTLFPKPLALLVLAPLVFGAGRAVALTAGARSTSTPVITAVAPARPEPGATAQRLTITGREFQPRLELMVTTPEGGTMQLKEKAIQARTETEFQADVLMATPGRYQLVVTNPDGGISAPFRLDVQGPQKPVVPVIDRILPENIRRSPDAQTLTVQGRNFGSGFRAVVTDPAGTDVAGVTVRAATASSFTLIVRLDRDGSYTLVVSNSTGASSNAATITVR